SALLPGTADTRLESVAARTPSDGKTGNHRRTHSGSSGRPGHSQKGGDSARDHKREQKRRRPGRLGPYRRKTVWEARKLVDRRRRLHRERTLIGRGLFALPLYNDPQRGHLKICFGKSASRLLKFAEDVPKF